MQITPTSLHISDKKLENLISLAGYELCKVTNWLKINKLLLTIKKITIIIHNWQKNLLENVN